MKKVLFVLLCVVIGISVAGCVVTRETVPVKEAAAAESEEPNVVSRTYPSCCGDVRIDKKMPREVSLNSSFDYEIVVTNLSDVALSDIMVAEHLADNFQFRSASPPAQKDGATLVWRLDSLTPKASKKFVVSGVVNKTGEIWHCANTTYVIPACASTRVTEPQLALAKAAPNEVLLCDDIPLKFTVSNRGTGSATNVRITDTLPDGLTTVDGAKTIRINVGTLAPDETKTYAATVRAQRTEIYANKAVATADGGLSSESRVTSTKVTRPVLAIAKSGPERQYLGRRIRYTITVTNKGSAPARDMVVEDTIPSGVKDVQVSEGGKIVGSKVVWDVGTLRVNSSQKVTVSYLPSEAGSFSNTAGAKAYCADAVTDWARTSVEGIAAILLEVIDVSDPIEIGDSETYQITVTNQGSAPDTNILINCFLEEHMQYVSSSGVTRGVLVGSTVKFNPLPSLAAGEKVSWEVVVKAIKPGDVRFRVTMNSDQLIRDVEETEATNFYR